MNKASRVSMNGRENERDDMVEVPNHLRHLVSLSRFDVDVLIDCSYLGCPS